MSDTCPQCGHALKQPRPEYPQAERLHIAYVGRGLYAIDGKVGLWFCSRKRADPASEDTFAKGPNGEGIYYRAVEAEERIRKAMGLLEKQEATP